MYYHFASWGGAEVKGHHIKIGHHGKSAIGISFKHLFLGGGSKTFESFNGKKDEPTPFTPESGISFGGEIGVLLSAHASFSISFSGIIDNFVIYGKEHDWWR